MSLTATEKKELVQLLSPYLRNAEIQSMKHFCQHGTVSTFEHCIHVSALCFLFNRRLHLRLDEPQLIRVSVLHDFFLYDWHMGCPTERMHGFTHADTACENAVRVFHISNEDQSVIRTHMWPLTLTKIPASRTAWLLCVSDKIAAMGETIFYRRENSIC